MSILQIDTYVWWNIITPVVFNTHVVLKPTMYVIRHSTFNAG